LANKRRAKRLPIVADEQTAIGLVREDNLSQPGDDEGIDDAGYQRPDHQ
jgi:hypothetical protein